MRSLDVLVVGGGPGALATAALLGRRGMRGMVVDQHERGALTPASRHDWTWDEAASPVAGRVHELLGVQESTRRMAAPLKPGLRWLTPDARVEFEPERTAQALLSELLGINPSLVSEQLVQISESATRVGVFLEDTPALPAGGFFDRRRLASKLADCPDLRVRAENVLEPRLFGPLRGLLPLLTVMAPSPGGLSMGRFARPLDLLLKGPRVPDTSRPLREVLGACAARYGFEVHRGKVLSLEPEGRRHRVRASNRRGVDLADLVIDASWGLCGIRTLPERALGKRFTARLEAGAPVAHLARLEWRVDAKALPEPLGPSALLVSWHPRIPAAWLTISDADQDRALVTVEVPVGMVTSATDLDPTLVRVEALLRAVAPFFSRGRPVREPPQVSPLFSAELDSATGLGGLPVRTPIRNVLVGGPTVLPGCASLEGAYYAALQAADATEEILGSRARA